MDFPEALQFVVISETNKAELIEKNCARPVSELIGNRQSAIGNKSEAERRAYIDSKRLAYVSEAPRELVSRTRHRPRQ